MKFITLIMVINKCSVTFLVTFCIIYGCTNEAVNHKWSFFLEFRENLIVHSIYKDSINIPSIENWATARLSECNQDCDEYFIADGLFHKIGDFHSSIITPEEVLSANYSTFEVEKFPENINFTIDNQYPDIPILKIRDVICESNEDITLYVDSLNTLIKTNDKVSNLGWVIDLRENEGGNFSAMFLGLAPFIGIDTSLYLKYQNGHIDPVFIKDGFLYIDTTKSIVSINTYKLLYPNKPIAVLIGPSTTSAAEFIAVSLETRSNVETFGQPTKGFTTGMKMIQLSNGAIINLSNSVLLNKYGERYGNKVFPRVSVHFKQNQIGTKDDPVIKRSISWIKSITQN